MYNASQSTQIFSNSKLGLQRIYQLLSKDTTGGISLTDIAGNLDNVSSNDLSFVQLLQGDFSKVDTDVDGKITQAEFTKMLEKQTTQGMTYEQLSALASQSGSTGATGDNKSLLQTVMENFNEVDTNHDGKVTKAEIDAYKFTSEKDKIKAEFDKAKLKASSSIFYSDDSVAETSSDDNTVSDS